MTDTRNPSERRGAPRNQTRIGAVAKTSQGQRHSLEINDLSIGGCAIVVAGPHGLKPGTAYGLKINGLETLGSVAAWTAGQSAGLEFERPLHPAVADHIAALNPRPLEDAEPAVFED